MLRSGWRALLFLAGFAFVGAVLGILVYRVVETLGFDLATTSTAPILVNAFISIISAVLVSWLCVVYLEGLPFRSLGISFTVRWHEHLAIGIIIGISTLAISVVIAVVSGGLDFSLNSSASSGEIAKSLALSFLVFGAAAAFEEILFRGYVLQTFARSGLAWLAIILTSVFFGMIHAGNPNAGVISSVNTMLAGVWFGVAYLKTRDLWFVWGMHLMWNWAQGAIFGIEVSGITSVTHAPIFKEADQGPTWLTGQEYGIEGGIACTIAIIISVLLILRFPGLKPDPELLRMTASDYADVA